ncbi:MAG: hypothetical protein JOZ04_11405, partial [Acidimicrobiia bacterium]|nr:hypothetical protein [Acidimicrobiia bacterium]
VEMMSVERPQTVFYDVGAVVYFLRLVPWIVPGLRRFLSVAMKKSSRVARWMSPLVAM